MSIPLEKMTRRQSREAAEWADRIGMFCLAESIWRALAARVAEQDAMARPSASRGKP